MRKFRKLVLVVLSILSCSLFALGLTACSYVTTTTDTQNTNLNENNKIAFKSLTVTKNNVYGKVSNETKTYSFINEIELVGNAGYTVYTDLQGTNPIPTKTVNLEIGDNVFYILETCGNDSNLYTVTVRRKPVYTVKFVLDGDDQVIPEQHVEEDAFATTPFLQNKPGYNYTFDYDLYNDITQDITVNVTCNAIFARLNDIITGLTDYGKTLTEITIPSSIDNVKITSISDNAFYNCGSLTSITIPDSVTSIGNNAFYNCANLTNLTLSDSIASIGDYAFYNCANLTNLTLPDSTTSIGNYAFYGCKNLNSFVFTTPKDVMFIYPLDNYEIVKDFSDSDLQYNQSIELWENHYGTDFTSTTSNLVKAVCSGEITNVYNNYKEGYCIEITYNKTLKIIYKSLSSNIYVNIGDVVKRGTVIGETSNTMLDLQCPNGYVHIEVEVNGNHVDPKNYLTDKFISIGSYAFSCCDSLTSIEIPLSVISLDSYIFNSCTNLTEIYFAGTVEQWSDITLIDGWNTYSEIKKIICTDGEITL